MIEAKTRAVTRAIRPGNESICAWCEEKILYTAVRKLRHVIVNVYEGGKWSHVVQYHVSTRLERECYLEAGEPYGKLEGLPAGEAPQ